MKKIKIILPLLLVANFFANAQTIKISGTVRNQSGNPLHYAFVQDKIIKNGVYTDVRGAFTLDVNPGSKLRVNCAGYNDTTIAVDNKTAFSIVLSQAPGVIAKPIAGTSEHLNNVVESSFRDLVNLDGPPIVIQQGSILPSFTVKQETRGSRYFFQGWVHGFVINAKDSLIQRPEFLFDYDKTEGGLLLSQDGKSAVEIDRDLVKSFTLYGQDGEMSSFDNVPAISKNRYAEVIEKGNKYKIYKLINTEFIKSNYQTNGISSSGNQYDEYVDNSTYYVIGNDGAPRKIALKKKSLKEAFNDDLNKLNDFMKTNDGDIDDNYLAALGDYMNK
ncbi:MAG TPA: carboxypeptidase-like regulatory domain-containing protein [Mucilaginibacter sp.]|jgi:hypothetical protein|nr:carboxypeptidase-like regulatory domain-containing protein [Mucilaginibacter sp.]